MEWRHGLVQPLPRRHAPLAGGTAVAVADREGLGRDVRPADEADDGTDGNYSDGNFDRGSSDDEPYLVSSKRRRPRDGESGSDSSNGESARRGRLGRHPSGGVGLEGEGGGGGSERGGGDAGAVQCDRCGESGHSGAQCRTHLRARGACHCAFVPRRHSGLSLSRGWENYRVHKSGSVITKMPRDGSCLFHAMTGSLARMDPRPANPSASRAEIANWLAKNARTMVHGVYLKDWIKWDSDRQWTVPQYANLVRGQGFWGGEIEMVACSMNSGVNVVVWVEVEDEYYLRTAAYMHGGSGAGNVHLLYVAGMHYDLLVPRYRPIAGGGRGSIGV